MLVLRYCGGTLCDLFIRTECLKAATYTLEATASCETTTPPTGAQTETTIEFGGPATPDVSVKVLDPPNPGNVQISYSFPHAQGGGWIKLYENGSSRGQYSGLPWDGSLNLLLSWGRTYDLYAGANCQQTFHTSFSVLHTPIEHQIRIGNVTPGIPSYEEAKKIPASDIVDAFIPLGTVLNVWVVRTKLPLDPLITIPSTYTVTTSDIIPPIPPPPMSPPTLRPDDVLLRFGEVGGVQDFVPMLALHLGLSSIKISPADGSFGPTTLNIHVVEPPFLGLTENQYDEGFVTLAHGSGVPPQYLKGQAFKESANGKMIKAVNYRYEPCSWDYGIVSTGQKRISTLPWSLYKLDEQIGVTLIPGVQDDLEHRTKLRTLKEGANGELSCQPTSEFDTGVTAESLWLCNDKVGPKMNWSTQKCGNKAKIVADLSLLDFTAQTPTAASYGIFQVMYGRALEEKWGGVQVDSADATKRSQAPKYLFDRPEYIEIGGGTMTMGTAIDVKNFMKLQAGSKVCKIDLGYPSSGILDSFEAFEEFLERAFQGYNCKKVGYGPGVIEYGWSSPPITTEVLLP